MGQVCDHLYISPHLDDVVLSCALRLLQDKSAGKKVTVVTLFSKGLPITEPLDLYGGRRQEDRNALAHLDVNDVRYLGFSDAPFRNIFYHNFQRIIMEQHPADAAFARTLAERVNQLYDELSPDTVFLPLAVGTHRDHRHTHQLWCDLPSQANIVFYEDRPYSFLPANLQMRLKEIGATPVSDQNNYLDLATGEKEVEAFSQGLSNITMYKNVLKSKKQRFRYVLSAARKLEAPADKSNLKISAESIRSNDKTHLQLIQSAVAAYTSQIPMLFDNMDTFTRESASYNRVLDDTALYCERYWHLTR